MSPSTTSIIRNTKFIGNSITTSGGKGGAIYQDAGNISVIGCSFENNVADLGGAIYGPVVGYNSRFEANKASSNGGAVYSLQGVNVTSCSLEVNSAFTEGGAIYSTQNIFVLSSRFSSNSAQYGGGFIGKGNTYLVDSLFTSNVASENGGGFKADGSSIIENNQFYFNNAKEGASFYLSDFTTATVTDYYGGTNGGLNISIRGYTMKNEGLNLGCDTLKNSSGLVYNSTWLSLPTFVSASPSMVRTEGGTVTFNLNGNNANIRICKSSADPVGTCVVEIGPGSGSIRKIGNECYLNSILSYLPPTISSFDLATGIVSGDNFGREIGRIYAELIPSNRTCQAISITNNSVEFTLNCPEITYGESLIVYVGGVPSTPFPLDPSYMFNYASSTGTIYELVSLFFQNPNAANPLVLKLPNIDISAYDLRRTEDQTTSLQLSTQSSANMRAKEQEGDTTFMVFFTSSHSEREISSKDSSISFSSKIHGLSLLDTEGNPMVVKDSKDEISITMTIQDVNSSQQLEELECLYWDSSESVWSTKGCRKGSSNFNRLECLCTHLTNFTVGRTSKSVSSLSPQSTTPIGLIIGVAVGGALFIVVIIVVILVVLRSKKRKEGSFLELKTNSGVEDKIVLGEKIGQGGFGSVYAATYCSTTQVAVKLQQKNSDNKLNLIREATIMKELHHPNVVLYMQTYDTNEGGIGLMMEFIPNGNLLDSLRRGVISSSEKINVISDIVGGMTYIHEKGVIHCDLSSRNVLLTEGNRAKIGDFGSAKKVGEKNPNIKTAPRWSPPEVLKGGEFTFEGDVFSFGITCWEIISDGLIPYGSMSNNDVASHVIKGNRPPIPIDYEEWNQIISLCWEGDPSKRCSFKSISAFFRKLSDPLQPAKPKEVRTKKLKEDEEGTYVEMLAK
eukprot:TRINITY_DN4955_c0_g1_i7.p1 TRINITY_DN4955_c0_g1~~TRINITY_DN4955_c0_g1_i7.p1  ORF type:complete len:903 (-),score=286.32 TRINITY_DN4955_c0_g1_i7:57-2765(-)